MSAKDQVDEFSKEFEYEFLLISYLSSGTISVVAWLLDSGATYHMTGAQESLKRFIESDSDVYV
jgi:hypothetical protein